MRLTKKNITYYLLDKGFLQPEPFLSGDYVVTQTMSRNCIFKVEHQQTKGLFIKQLLNQDATNSYLMQKDATSHYLIHQSALYKETAKHIPEYYGYDPNHNILVTEYFNGTKNLHEVTYIEKELSTKYAEKMAAILASFHFDIRPHLNENTSLQFYTKQLPWILNIGNIHKADPNGTNNSVILELHKHPELLKKIDKAASSWEVYSLIHGDIKWMNFIVMPNQEDVKLIDWEIADIGDPIWDVAGVLQSYLSSWVLSFNNENVQQHIQYQGQEFLNLKNILPAVQHFWDHYAKLQEFTKEEKKDKLLKVLSFMAIRMVQTAFENNMSQIQLFANSARIIQFCDHILTHTESVAKEWNLID